MIREGSCIWRAVRSAVEFAKTLLVLAALWGLALGIGWAAGALPTERPTPSTTDASVDVSDAAVELDAGTPDAVDAFVEPVPRGTPRLRHSLCTAASEIVATWGDVTGDDADELAIVCADGVRVFAWVDAVPTLIATVVLATPTQLVRGIAIGDVDDDTRADLVIAADPGLYVLFRSADGGFAPPRVLAPSANHAVALGALDASSGLDVAAVHGPLDRPEVWAFHGGSAPVRSGTAPAPLGARGLACVDLDVDGHIDVIASGPAQTALLFGDSRGAFPRTRSIATGARAIARLGTVLHLESEHDCELRAAPEQASDGECLPSAALPPSASDVAERGGRVLAWAHPQLLALPSDPTASPDVAASRVVGSLATSAFGVHRIAWLDDAHAVLVGTEPESDGRRLETVVVELAGLTPAEWTDGDVVDAPRAPLVLSVQLPDSNTP